MRICYSKSHTSYLLIEEREMTVMDFKLSEEHEMIRQSVRDFAEGVLAPKVCLTLLGFRIILV
jgi:hypothetical protein